MNDNLEYPLSPPSLVRQNAIVIRQHICRICQSIVPDFMGFTEICSNKCFNIVYHDNEILHNYNFYRIHYDECKKILYNIIPTDLANIVLYYHDHNLHNHLYTNPIVNMCNDNINIQIRHSSLVPITTGDRSVAIGCTTGYDGGIVGVGANFINNTF